MPTAEYNTTVADVVVPERFTDYVQQITRTKSRLVQSGAIVQSDFLNNFLAGGGLTTNVPSWVDLDDTDANVSSDETADTFGHTLNGTSVDFDTGALTTLHDSRPLATATDQEIAVRMNRNQSWASATLSGQLAGSDPMASIANRVAAYWLREEQRTFKALINGISKDNGANDSGDYAHEIVGAAYTEGVTDFSAEAVLDAMLTMGDSMDELTLIMMHSVVKNRAQKNNLIDYIPDAEGRVQIPTFMGKLVIVDDGMPTGTGVVRADGTAGVAGMYETWLFGPGAVQMGNVPPPNATELEREAKAGNGGGQDILYSRVQWCMHPTGHAYTGTAPNGGPSNAATTNNLNIATSWNRVYPERKMIPFARLITRES